MSKLGKYTRNQVELLETLLEQRFTNEQLEDVFEFIEDIYNDGLTEKNGTTEHNETTPYSEILERVEEIKKHRAEKKAWSAQDFL